MSKINDLKAKTAAHDALIVQRNRVELKRSETEAEIAEITVKIESGKVKLDALEMAAILDQATDTELHTARAAQMDLVEKFRLANVRFKLIKDAIAEIDAKIEAAAREIKTAKHEFCLEVRNAKLAEIQSDKKLKAAIIEAMAAMACNGLLQYTNDSRLFAHQNLLRLIPEISEQEVLDATEKFKQINFSD